MFTTVELVELESPSETLTATKDDMMFRTARTVSRVQAGKSLPSSSQRPFSIDIGTYPSTSDDTTPEGRDPDLERSRPPSPLPVDRIVEALPTWREPFMNRFRLLAVCIANLVNGLNDSAAGALIPYLER
jgi:hypothetical protein